jgi:TPR repeat protein
MRPLIDMWPQLEELAVRPLQQHRRDRMQELLAVPLAPDGRLPGISDISPYLLGCTATRYADEKRRADPYVTRDLDEGVGQALQQDLFVLVVGHSKAGKTRTAYEAAITILPDAALLVPSTGMNALRQLADEPLVVEEPRPLLIWLDDLNRYLPPVDRLDMQLLRRWSSRGGRTVVLATLRTEERERLRTQGGGEPAKPIQQLLDAATELWLPTRLQPSERETAQALYPEENFSGNVGIGERLVAGPELLRKYLDAGHPTGWSLVQAAIDWYRVGLGLHRAITEQDLRPLAVLYLEDEWPAVDLTQDEYITGLEWARRPVAGSHGRIGMINRVKPAMTDAHYRFGYEPFDYILAATDTAGPAERQVAEYAWAYALEHGLPSELVTVGKYASDRDEVEVARTAWQQAANAGSADAANLLGESFENDDSVQAQQWFRRAAAMGNADAAVTLAYFLEDENRFDEAEHYFRQGVDAGQIEATFNFARFLQDQGREEEAEHYYRLEVQNGVLSAFAAYNLGNMLYSQGQREAAEKFYRFSAEKGFDLAAKPLAGLLLEAGRLDEAEHWFGVALDNGQIEAAVGLGGLRAEQGHMDEAESYFRQAVDAGDMHGALFLALLLDELNRSDEAEQYYLMALEAGYSEAANGLGILRAEQGHADEAESYFRQAVDAGDMNGARNLGILLEDQNRPNEAEQYYRMAADSGDAKAAHSLNRLLNATIQPDTAEQDTHCEDCTKNPDSGQCD